MGTAKRRLADVENKNLLTAISESFETHKKYNAEQSVKSLSDIVSAGLTGNNFQTTGYSTNLMINYIFALWILIMIGLLYVEASQ